MCSNIILYRQQLLQMKRFEKLWTLDSFRTTEPWRDTSTDNKGHLTL